MCSILFGVEENLVRLIYKHKIYLLNWFRTVLIPSYLPISARPGTLGSSVRYYFDTISELFRYSFDTSSISSDLLEMISNSTCKYFHSEISCQHDPLLGWNYRPLDKYYHWTFVFYRTEPVAHPALRLRGSCMWSRFEVGVVLLVPIGKGQISR